MSAIAREAIANKLDELDEKEVLRQQRWRTKKPMLPHHDKPQGLGPRKTSSLDSLKAALTSGASTFVMPEKIKKSLKSWAEYLDEADGDVETDRRVKTIIKDIRSRGVTSDEDVAECYKMFVEFYEQRSEAISQTLKAKKDEMEKEREESADEKKAEATG